MMGNRSNSSKNFVEKFIGIYNKRTRRIMETIHVTVDELHQTMAPFNLVSQMFTQASAATLSPVPKEEEECNASLRFIFTEEKFFSNVPSIYIQLFWNTLTHDAKTRVYSFQVDEHWLTLSVDLLRKALDVTPADSAHPFESPPAGTQMRLEVSQASVKQQLSEWLSRETCSIVGSNSKQSHVALVGPNPEHMQDVFLATNYPKVHESLKNTTKAHVHLENPPSSSRTLSSMKNLRIHEWEADDEGMAPDAICSGPEPS
ncbi:hypothetical protein Tco_1066807 [Tanacetum coccineum]|uniref:Uncharacterized protein n=1 Tax=Tanacetum coccineum TaxID=301880 RepID=A0ABQ5HBN4_9ASTR